MAYIPKNKSSKPWITPRPAFENRRPNPFYQTAVWRRFRIAVLMSNPLCAFCYKDGIYTPATDLDHIKSINPNNAHDTENGKYGEPLSEDNVQPLCRRCHMSESGKTKHK